MNKYIYIAAVALCGSGFAQNQNQVPTQPQPSQTRPAQPPQATTPAPRTAGERASEAVSNLVTDWRLEDLPQPVQKTIREQAAGQPIADIDRETRTGRNIWEVEIEKAGRNTEIHIAEDGTLLPEARGILDRSTDATGRAIPPAATGTPGGTQTGRSTGDLAMGTKWEDLPTAIQQKAMQFGGKEKVADVDREEWRGRVAYEVEFRREGRNLEIHFGEDGTILESNDPAAAPAQGAAPGATPSPSTQPGQTRPTPPPSSIPPSQPNQNPTQPRP